LQGSTRPDRRETVQRASSSRWNEEYRKIWHRLLQKTLQSGHTISNQMKVEKSNNGILMEEICVIEEI
jgi:hypothetical protein